MKNARQEFVTSKTPAGRHATEGYMAEVALTGFEPGTLGVTVA